MIESGLYRFYESFTTFLTKLRGYQFLNYENDDPRALTMKQLWGPLILCACLLGFATIMLVIEIIVFKYNQRRNQPPNLRPNLRPNQRAGNRRA